VILHFAVSVEYRLVTDRQTNRETHDDSIYLASIASSNVQRALDQGVPGPLPARPLLLLLLLTYLVTLFWTAGEQNGQAGFRDRLAFAGLVLTMYAVICYG